MLLMTRQTDGIGALLRAARAARNWSHEDVAHRIDASLASYSRWERGKNIPQGHNLNQLMEVLDLDPREVMAAIGGSVAPGVQAENAERLALETGMRLVELEERMAALESKVASMNAQSTAAPEPRDADGSTWAASRAVQDAVRGARPGAAGKGSDRKG